MTKKKILEKLKKTYKLTTDKPMPKIMHAVFLLAQGNNRNYHDVKLNLQIAHWIAIQCLRK